MKTPDALERLRAQRPEVNLPEAAPPLAMLDGQEGAAVSVANPRSRRGRSIALLAGAAAAAAVVVAVPFVVGGNESGSAGPESSATPSAASATSAAAPSAADQLAELAAVAAANPIPGEGDVRYVKVVTQGYTVVVGDTISLTPFPAGGAERWSAADGSGREQMEGDAPYDYPEEENDGNASWCLPGVTVENFQQLAGDPSSTQMSTTEVMSAMSYCSSRTPIAPDAQSVMLTLLSQRSDVTALGTVTDELGRTGLGFAAPEPLSTLPGSTVQREIVIDPATGRLLAWADRVMDDPNNLAPVPYVLVGQTVETVAMVPSVGDRP